MSTTKSKNGPIARRWLSLFYVLPVLFVLGLLGYMARSRATRQPPPARKISAAPFASVKIQGLEAHLFAPGGALRASGNDLFIEFRDAQGKLADVGEVELVLVLKMPGAVLHSLGKVMRTSTPGQYRTTLDPNMAGEWTATLSFTGPRGQAEASLTVKVM